MSKKATSPAPVAPTPTQQPEQDPTPVVDDPVEEVPPSNYLDIRLHSVTNLPPNWVAEAGTEPEYPEQIFRYELEIASTSAAPYQMKHTFRNGRLTHLLPAYTNPVNETQLPAVVLAGGQEEAPQNVPTVPVVAEGEDGADGEHEAAAGVTWWFHPDGEIIEVKEDPKAKKDVKKAPPKGAPPEPPKEEVKEPPKPNSAYPPNYLLRTLLSAEDVEKLEECCEGDVGFRFTFRRVLKPGTPGDWEDANEVRYRAEGIIPITPFKEPGTTTSTYKLVLTPYVDPAAEEVDKKGKKAAPKKAKGGMPAALLPEDAGDGEHPYAANQTTLMITVSVALPLTKLPQNRPRSDVRPNDLIPRRVKPQQRPMDAAKLFSLEVTDMCHSLVKEFREFVGTNSLPIEGEDTRKAFFQYLSTSGQGYALKEKLIPYVQKIVREKFSKKPGCTAAEMDKIYNELYVYLLEQLHITLNKIFSREALAPKPEVIEKPENKWKRLADEAEAIQEFSLAGRYHQERLVHGPADGDAEELPSVWCEYAEFCLRVRDAARAEQAYREAIAIDVGHTASLLGYGLLLLSRGRYKEAEVYLQSAVDVAMDSPVTWSALALYYECHEQLLASVGDEDEGNRRAKSQRECRYCLTEAQRHMDAAEGAGEDPSRTPHRVLADYLLVLHLEELALMSLKHCEKGMSTTLSLGRLYYQTMQYEEATSQVNEIFALEADNFEGHILMGDILSQEGRPVEAEGHYEKALRMRPNGATGGVYIRLGNIYMSLGRYKEAKDTFILGVRVWCCGLTWMGVGIAYYRMDDYAHAEQALNESNILNNQNPKTWAYLCLCCLKTRRDEEADFALNQALKLHLGDVDLLCEIGTEEQALGRLNLCDGIFRKCVALKESYSTRLLLAQTLMALRQYEDAQAEFELTHELAANDTDRAYVEEQLRLLTDMKGDM